MLFAFITLNQLFSDRARNIIETGAILKMLELHLHRLSGIVLEEKEEQEGLNSKGFSKDTFPSIKVKDLVFRYSDSDPIVLNSINFEIASGEFVAITGETGGGKSTLLKLITKLLSPTSGEIMIDNENLGRISPQYWRSQIGVVMQDDSLLAGSIKENITFFDRNFEESKFRYSLKVAALTDDIKALPMRENSLIGDMGSTLSGGQKQKVYLARALYRSPKLLMLDEGTANLDPLLEKEISKSIKGLNCTRIVVAHRPELVNAADSVYHLENGTLTKLR